MEKDGSKLQFRRRKKIFPKKTRKNYKVVWTTVKLPKKLEVDGVEVVTSKGTKKIIMGHFDDKNRIAYFRPSTYTEEARRLVENKLK